MQENGEKINIFSLEEGCAYGLEVRGWGSVD